jgi:hypothetical protein
LLGDRVRRRREPDVGDAGLGDVVHLAHQEFVPSPVLLPGFPVEALMQPRIHTKISQPDQATTTLIETERTVQNERQRVCGILYFLRHLLSANLTS